MSSSKILKEFSFSPKKLNLNELPYGLVECDNNSAIECARLALSQIEGSDDGFPINLFPKYSLFRCAILGSYPVHYRNNLYDKYRSLQNIVENKINNIFGEKYIIANNSKSVYYSFKCKEFKYDQLYFLKDSTYAIDFILLLPEGSGIFIFCEDAPACFMGFQDKEQFERNFISPEQAMSIFVEYMDEWQITGSKGERLWLEKAKGAMSLQPDLLP